MSRIIDRLKKIEEARLAGESAGRVPCKDSSETNITLEDLKQTPSLKGANEHGKCSDKSKRFLEEFKSLEKELLELREEEDKVLSSIKEILEGSKKPVKREKKR